MKIHYKIIKQFCRFLRGEGGRGGVPKSFSRKIPKLGTGQAILFHPLSLVNTFTHWCTFSKIGTGAPLLCHHLWTPFHIWVQPVKHWCSLVSGILVHTVWSAYALSLLNIGAHCYKLVHDMLVHIVWCGHFSVTSWWSLHQKTECPTTCPRRVAPSRIVPLGNPYVLYIGSSTYPFIRTDQI